MLPPFAFIAGGERYFWAIEENSLGVYNYCTVNRVSRAQQLISSGRKGVRNMLYLPHEDGQGLVEYGLILVLVAIVVVIVLALLGTQLSQVFSRVVGSVPGGA